MNFVMSSLCVIEVAKRYKAMVAKKPKLCKVRYVEESTKTHVLTFAFARAKDIVTLLTLLKTLAFVYIKH